MSSLQVGHRDGKTRLATGRDTSPAALQPAQPDHDLNILIIEDDSAGLISVRGMLEHSTYGNARLHIVHEIAQARMAMGTRQFDLVVTDFWIGTKTSISLINDIGDIWPHIPVIVLGVLPASGVELHDAVASLFHLSKSSLNICKLEITMAHALAPASRHRPVRAGSQQ